MLTAIAAANANRPNVRMLPGVYNASLTLTSSISIHGEGATLVAPGTGLLVQGAATIEVFDLAITKQGGATANERLGVYCTSDGANVPKLRLDRVVIETQGDARPMAVIGGIVDASRTTLKAPKSVEQGKYTLLVTGTARFDRSRIEGGGGIAAAEGSVSFTNSILSNVGGSPTEGALLAAGGGSISLAYSTIFESALACGIGDSPACASAARTGVCIENSIVNKPGTNADAISGSLCRCDYCAVSPQQGAVVGSNNLVGVNPSLRDPAGGDFHLNADSPAIDAAHPSIPGSPDYDGVTRPQNGRSDLGAFEFKP